MNMEIWPLPLESEPPCYLFKRKSISDEEIKTLMNASKRGFMAMSVELHLRPDDIIVLPHDEPLDRLAGMISEDGEIFGGYVATLEGLTWLN
jgi:hypothetical protein